MIGQIEDGIIARIKWAVENSILGYHVEAMSFGTDLATGIERAVKRFPAVAAVYTGATLIKEASTSAKYRHTWNVMCCAQNLRNEKDTRRGDGARPGSYQMAEDVARLLLGFAVKSEVEEGVAAEQLCAPFTVTGIRPVLNDVVGANQLASIYSVDVATTAAFDHLGESITDIFETLHANWDVPPHGNVSTTLPADDTADATDHVTLETE